MTDQPDDPTPAPPPSGKPIWPNWPAPRIADPENVGKTLLAGWGAAMVANIYFLSGTLQLVVLAVLLIIGMCLLGG